MDIRAFFKKMHPRVSLDSRMRIRQKIIDPSKSSISYYLLVCLSAIIAAFGLLNNSTAVVIGAMLVAPLMGPIFAIALSLTIGDSRTFKIALISESAGIILVVALSALIGLIPLRPDFGSEIIVRTQPNIYDIFIALASGFAGAYAMINEKISPALPGVAIATALVPPLAVCGLNISACNWSSAGGALLLFSVNLVAIEFAAASMFVWFGIAELPSLENSSRFKFLMRRLGISFLVLLIAATFMSETLVTIIAKNKLNKEIRLVLTENLSSYAGAHLSEMDFNQTKDSLIVKAVITTPKEFDPDRVSKLRESLQTSVDTNIQLIVSSVITKNYDSKGQVFLSDDELKRQDELNRETEFMNKVSQVLSEQLDLNGAQVTDITKDTKDDFQYVTASIRTPDAITPAEVLAIQQHLDDEVDQSIRLIVRSILTKDADSTHFLKDDSDIVSALQGEDLILYQSLNKEISEYLSNIKGVTVVDLSFNKSEKNINVFTTVNTPVTIDPGIVANLQGYLRDHVNPDIKLTVHSVVGGTATADTFLDTNDND